MQKRASIDRVFYALGVSSLFDDCTMAYISHGVRIISMYNGSLSKEHRVAVIMRSEYLKSVAGSSLIYMRCCKEFQRHVDAKLHETLDIRHGTTSWGNASEDTWFYLAPGLQKVVVLSTTRAKYGKLSHSRMLSQSNIQEYDHFMQSALGEMM